MTILQRELMKFQVYSIKIFTLPFINLGIILRFIEILSNSMKRNHREVFKKCIMKRENRVLNWY